MVFGSCEATASANQSKPVMRLRILLAQTAFVALVIASWAAGSRLGALDPTIMPPPAKVVVALGSLLRSPDFLADSLDTITRVGAAFAIGAPIALAVGFVMGENIAVGRSMSPVFNLVLSVPQSIFLPLFVLLFGLGFTEKLIFGITHVFFVVAINAMAAVRQVPHGQVALARSFGANTLRIYRSIYLPAMAPQVVTGLRLGLIFGIIGILLAEMYASRSGLGVLLLRWGESYAVDKLMAATVLISVATIIINETMRIWEARAGRWRNAAENA
jgi:NitT/TauT family transport system permease protein